MYCNDTHMFLGYCSFVTHCRFPKHEADPQSRLQVQRNLDGWSLQQGEMQQGCTMVCTISTEVCSLALGNGCERYLYQFSEASLKWRLSSPNTPSVTSWIPPVYIDGIVCNVLDCCCNAWGVSVHLSATLHFKIASTKSSPCPYQRFRHTHRTCRKMSSNNTGISWACTLPGQSWGPWTRPCKTSDRHDCNA